MALTDSFLSALECPICFQEYRDPLIIQCHHSFCRQCLQQWVSINTLRNRKFYCPVCKDLNQIPPKGVLGFQKSFIVEQFKDLVLRTNPSYPMCKIHAVEDLRFFCKKCEIAVCRDCKILYHDGHTAERVQDVSEEMRKDLKELIDTVAVDLNAVGKYREKHENDKAEIDRLKRDAVAEIRKHTIAMKNEIDSLSRAGVAEVDKLFQPLEESIERDVEESNRRHQSLIDFKIEAMKMVDNGTDHEVIDSQKSLSRKYDETSENVIQSWFQLGRPLENFRHVFKSGRIDESGLKAMLGVVKVESDTNAEELGTLSLDNEMQNDGYATMMKKRLQDYRKRHKNIPT